MRLIALLSSPLAEAKLLLGGDIWGEVDPRLTHRCAQEAPCDYSDHFYYNELACECFVQFECEMLCLDDKVLHPAKYCECTDQATVDALYPDWATEGDIETSKSEGVLKALTRPDEVESWRVCPRDEYALQALECH